MKGISPKEREQSSDAVVGAIMSLPDVRLQVAALTLGEELNFTRAAERLGITQPALSKRIGELEQFLGFAVFERGRRKVELTEAGRIFIRGCVEAQTLLERSILQAKTAGDDIQPVVTIGHSPYADPILVAGILGVYLPSFPTLRLRIESMFAQDLTHGVLSSELDLALISDPLESPRLTQVQIASHPLCAVMQSGHPAALKPQVEMADFGGVGWIVFGRKSHPGIYDRLMKEARLANVSPVELHHYVSPQEALALISESFGVAFVAKGCAEQLRGEIAVRPLAHPALRVSTYLVLSADQRSRLINEFGRAYLKKTLPKHQLEAASGQLMLGL